MTWSGASSGEHFVASNPPPNVPKVNGVIRDFGGKGDGVSDDSAAILATANASAGGSIGAAVSRGSGYFGPGIFIVTTNAVLTPTNFTTLPGIHWQGAGWFTSVLRFGTLGGATWFYDNGASARNQFNTFADIGFQGGDPATVGASYASLPANAKGFKVTSAGNEQGFRFFRCAFGYLDVDFDIEGTNTASEMKFFGCKFYNTRSTVYLLNNAQSYNHEFFGCDLEVIYGDVFNVSGNGGGAVKMYGGSVIMLDPGTSTNTYFFRASGGSGAGSFPFTFNGLRMELRGNWSNLATLANTLQVDLLFDNCQFQDQGTGTKALWLTVQAYATARFKGCSFNETAGTPIQINAGNTVSNYGQTGTVTFDDCMLPIDFSDRCFITQYWGAVRAINCHGSNVGAPAAGAHWAHDFDLRSNYSTAGQVGVWDQANPRSAGSPSDNALRIKVAQVKLESDVWPSQAEHTLKLPKYAIIKAIHLRKPAGSADVTVTTMRVGRNDKSGTDHLVSNSAAYNTTHTGDVNDYYYCVANTTNERTLRLYSSAATTGNLLGGLCFVEYL